ncbi:MAG: hypothetical protein AB7T22_07365 [Calditrichaceae bacterium]
MQYSEIINLYYLLFKSLAPPAAQLNIYASLISDRQNIAPFTNTVSDKIINAMICFVPLSTNAHQILKMTSTEMELIMKRGKKLDSFKFLVLTLTVIAIAFLFQIFVGYIIQ